jgi:membrane protein YdbS with pleckstrin-like domain
MSDDGGTAAGSTVDDPGGSRSDDRSDSRGGTGAGAILREPAHQVSPRAVPFWTVSALLGDAVLVVAAAVAYFLIPGVPGWVGLVVLLVAVAAVAHVVLMPRIRYRVHRWEVTDSAVHTREGWIGRESRIAPISRVQTVDSRQGALMRLFGLASITVTTASAAGPITVSCLDDETAREVVARLTAITAATEGDAT